MHILSRLRPAGRHRAPGSSRARHAVRAAEPVRVAAAQPRPSGSEPPLDGETLALVRPYVTAHERRRGRRTLLVCPRFVLAVPR